MIIHAVLGNPNHPEYGVATIPFPIPHDQYAHCMDLLEALEIGDAVKADCQVQEINSFYSVLKRTEMLPVNVEELNYLAKRLDMRLLDALIETGFRCTHVRQVPTFDLYMAYEKKAVVTVRGETYLTGPAIVFHCLDDELWDISSGDAGLVRRLFEERTVQLRHGDETIPAIAL